MTIHDDRSELSVLFDLFVADSAARTLLTPVMAGTGLTATQYAEYSLVLVHGPLSVTRFAGIANLPLTTASDTVRSMERRAHVARWTAIASRTGYALLLVSIVLFFVALAVGFSGAMATLVLVALATHTAVPVPESFRETIRAFEGDDLEDAPVSGGAP